MRWAPVFAGFLVAHMVGDYLFQTDWQARHKKGGLTAGGVSTKALASHVATYTLAFLPAFVWIADELDAGNLRMSVRVNGEAHLGKVDIVGRKSTGVLNDSASATIGSGDASLDIECNLGSVKVTAN